MTGEIPQAVGEHDEAPGTVPGAADASSAQARRWGRLILFGIGAIPMAVGAVGVVPSVDLEGLVRAVMTLAWAMVWGAVGATFWVTGALIGDPALPTDAMKKTSARLRGVDAIPALLIAATVQFGAAALRTALGGAGAMPALVLLGIAMVAGLGVRPTLDALRERVAWSLQPRQYVSVDAPPSRSHAGPPGPEQPGVAPSPRDRTT